MIMKQNYFLAICEKSKKGDSLIAKRIGMRYSADFLDALIANTKNQEVYNWAFNRRGVANKQ